LLKDYSFRKFAVDGVTYSYYSLKSLEERGLFRLAELPYSIKVLVENVLRSEDGNTVTDEDVESSFSYIGGGQREIPFNPARVLLQDFTGVPALVDLAAMRDAVKRLGKDPSKVNPSIPVDLVIDHSVQVDYFGTAHAYALNLDKEFETQRREILIPEMVAEGLQEL
jgi:aconitase (EC 4.2.1.3)